MGEKEVKKKKNFYKKWWFWAMILVMVIVICFTAIIFKGFNIILDEVGKLAIDLQNIDENITVYTSAGDNTLVIELRNWNNENEEKLSQIINLVKTKISNGELQLYKELVTLTYLESNEKDEALFIRMSYTLPYFTKNETQEYINFEDYLKAMDGYTSLYNSVY